MELICNCCEKKAISGIDKLEIKYHGICLKCNITKDEEMLRKKISKLKSQ